MNIVHNVARTVLALSCLCVIASAQVPWSYESQQMMDLQRLVERSPDDRATYLTLLRAGLETFRSPNYSIPDSAREDILSFKLVVEDINSIQAVINDLDPPWWTPADLNATTLLNRLKSRKVPLGYRRSVPLIDPWGTPYRVVVDAVRSRYKLVCAGSDRVFDPANIEMSPEDEDSRQFQPTKNRSLAEDIVFVDGKNFTKEPEYPPDAQTFLAMRCEPADEPVLGRVRCW